MHLLAGLDRPTSGEVWLGRTNLAGLDHTELTRLRRTRVGFMLQNFNLLPVADARGNVVLPLQIAGEHIDRDWVEQLLTAVGLQDRGKHQPPQLSGGEQQRVALARALIARPAVVFADEPTGNLDSQATEVLLHIFRRAVETIGQKIMLVTHDPLAASRTDRIVFLSDGRVARETGQLSATEVVATASRFWTDAAAWALTAGIELDPSLLWIARSAVKLRIHPHRSPTPAGRGPGERGGHRPELDRPGLPLQLDRLAYTRPGRARTGDVLLERDTARAAHLRIGNHVRLSSPDGLSTSVTVRGIYSDRALLDGMALQLQTFDQLTHQSRLQEVLVKLGPDADPATAASNLRQPLSGPPGARALRAPARRSGLDPVGLGARPVLRPARDERGDGAARDAVRADALDQRANA